VVSARLASWLKVQKRTISPAPSAIPHARFSERASAPLCAPLWRRSSRGAGAFARGPASRAPLSSQQQVRGRRAWVMLTSGLQHVMLSRTRVAEVAQRRSDTSRRPSRPPRVAVAALACLSPRAASVEKGHSVLVPVADGKLFFRAVTTLHHHSNFGGTSAPGALGAVARGARVATGCVCGGARRRGAG